MTVRSVTATLEPGSTQLKEHCVVPDPSNKDLNIRKCSQTSALAPDGFDDIDAVLPRAERERIVQGYAKASGFAAPADG